MFDIRRDNLVEHLLFKAIFSMAESRLEYVCILLARECTDSVGAFRDRPINDIVAYVERLGPSSSVSDNTFPEIVRRVRAIGLPFDSADVRALAAYRNAFVQNGFYVNYSSLDMRPMYNMPGWGALLVARDRAGQQLNYLAADSLFRVVKTMHAENRIVPITGNVAGPVALAAVGDELRRRNETLSVLYMSNVEQYLFQYGTMDAFAQNVAKLPRTNRSVVIRSLFSGGRGTSYSAHASYVPGQNSTSVMEYIDAFVADWTAGRIPSYYDLLFRASIPP
jgi:hypothetical protein